MAKSVKRKKSTPSVKKTAAKKTVPKKTAAKKIVPKKTAAKKSATKKPVTKKAVAKRPASKKTTGKKPVPKKTIQKKATIKKAVTKKAAKPAAKKPITKKATSKKAAVKRSVVNKVARKNNVQSKPVVNKAVLNGKPAVPKTGVTNQDIAITNSQASLFDDNISRGETGVDEKKEASVTGNEPIPVVHSIPAPVEKYARPADPYHGNISPTKRKVNMKPSGKKPLWNK